MLKTSVYGNTDLGVSSAIKFVASPAGYVKTHAPELKNPGKALYT